MSAIRIRRTAALAFAGVFAVVLFGALLLHAASATLTRPALYAEQLARADVYRFLTGDLVRAAVEDARGLDAAEFGEDFRANPVASSGVSPAQVARAVERAIPPDDLEAAVEPALLALAEYLVGERDEATIVIDIGDSLDALVRELTTLLRDGGAYEALIEREFSPMFEEWADGMVPVDDAGSGWAPFLAGGGADAGDSLVRVFSAVVTPEWLARHVEHALSELTAYLTGRAGGFDLRIDLDDAEADVAAAELEAILREADASELARAVVIEPTVEEHVGAAALLPYGITLARSEVVDALTDAAPPSWMEAQADAMARAVASYVAGRAEGFDVGIDVTAVRGDAAAALTAVAVTRLEASLSGLPACAAAAPAAAARDPGTRELPACLPPGVTAGDVAANAREEIAAAIEAFAVEPVPDALVLTEADLRDALIEDGGPDALAALDDLRELFTEGWSYSDDDFRAELSADDAGVLDDLRALLGEGYAVRLSGDDRQALEDGVEGAREFSGALRNAKWAAALLAAALLATVAALGGAGWRERFAWGGAALLAAAGLMAVAAGPIYEVLSGVAFDAFRDEITPDPGVRFALTSEQLSGKLVDIAQLFADAFAADLMRNSLLLALLGGVALAVSLSWERVAGMARREPR